MVPNTDPLAPVLDADDRIQFADHHRVAVAAGDYELRLTHHVEVKSKSVPDTTSKGEFSILGEQVALDGKAILQVFPPDRSRGDFWRVLPHLVLERNTLPWERSCLEGASEPATDPPWLALLVFHGDEAPTAQTKLLEDLLPGGDDEVPGLGTESSQHPKDPVQVIEVPYDLVAWQLSGNGVKGSFDPRYRAHSRRRLAKLDPKGNRADGPEELQATLVAILAANKLPKPRFFEGGPSRTTPSDAAPTQPDVPHGAAVLEELVEGKRWRVVDREHHETYEVWKDEAHHSSDSVASTGYTFFRVAHENATLLAARLPKPGVRNSCHLVSIENRCRKVGEDGVVAFNDPPDSIVRLISLKQWEFFCEDPSRDFKWILEALNGKRIPVEQGVLAAGGTTGSMPGEVPEPSIGNGTIDPEKRQILRADRVIGRIAPGAGWEHAKALTAGQVLDANNEVLKVDGAIVDLCHHRSPGMQLPVPEGATDELRASLRSGLTPMRHGLRNGDATVSWFRGALVSDAAQFLGGESVRDVLPAHSADRLLLWEEQQAVFDASYAAAWQLGRTVMLQNQRVAMALFHWKRQHMHEVHTARAASDLGFALPMRSHGSTPTGDTRWANTVNSWLGELAQLHHIPFHHLVPDERMLPPESLRFFSIDPTWMACLVDGALSIGRVASVPKKSAREAPAEERQRWQDYEHGFAASGILLRSEAVSGWPGMRIEGYEAVTLDSNLVEASGRVPILRMERLSDNVLLVLFEGEVGGINLHLRPELLHFGFDVTDAIGSEAGPAALAKELRNARGEVVVDQEVSPIPMLQGPSESEPSHLVDLDLLQLQIADKLGELRDSPAAEVVSESDADRAQSASALSSSIFALEMVAGAERVWFERVPSDAPGGES